MKESLAFNMLGFHVYQFSGIRKLIITFVSVKQVESYRLHIYNIDLVYNLNYEDNKLFFPFRKNLHLQKQYFQYFF